MFGDLELYEDETFFRDNTTGVLITPMQVYDLEVVACLVVKASDDVIFSVTENSEDISLVVEYVQEHAMYLRDTLQNQAENLRLLALSTCSSDYTDARTIVVTRMIPRT